MTDLNTSSSRLEQIRAREQAATKGPWDIANSRDDVPYLLDQLTTVTHERDELRETNKRLNRRAQSAEAALNTRSEDWNKRSTPAIRNHYYERAKEAEAQVEALTRERDEARQEIAKIRKLCTTAMVDSEYRALLNWRRQFVDAEEFDSPDPQMVAYAVTDAETLRQIHDVLDYAQACAEAQPADTRSVVGESEPGKAGENTTAALSARLAKVHALIEQWKDPEFWKDKGAAMDARDCADELDAILQDGDERREAAD